MGALLVACNQVAGGRVEVERVLFDDFNYASAQDERLAAHGWTVRADRHGPGVPGTWSKDLVSFVDDPDQKGNRLMRLTAVTAGTPGTTGQAQVYGLFEHFEGTYAARVRFSDRPSTGPDGDRVVQTFFAIADPSLPLDTRYSELDFEYLPNGGWGGYTTPTLYVTSWAAYSEKGPKDKVSTLARESLAGWQTLVVTVLNGRVTFSVGRRVLAVYRGNYYPDSQMRLAFNQWFIASGLLASGERREYVQDVDWVLQVRDRALTPQQVDQVVGQFRERQQTFRSLGR